MATITSAGTGFYDIAGSWTPAQVPVSGDKVIIAVGHNITLRDIREAGDDTATAITVNGILTHSRIASSELTCLGKIIFSAGSTHDMGSFASPIPLPYTAKILLNKSATLLANEFGIQYTAGAISKIFGQTKKRITTLTSAISAGATSINVTDATGWQIGDEVYLANTSSTNAAFDVCIISAGYAGGTTVPISATVYAHVIDTPISNMTNNVTINAFNPTYPYTFYVAINAASIAESLEWGYATIDNVGSVYQTYGVEFGQDTNYSATPWPNLFKYMESVSYITRQPTGFCLYTHTSSGACKTRLNFNNCSMISVGTGTGTQCVLEGGYCSFNNCFIAAQNPIEARTILGSIYNSGYICSAGAAGYILNINNTISNEFNGVTILSTTTNSAGVRTLVPQVFEIKLKNCDLFKFGTGLGRLVSTQSYATVDRVTYENCLVGTTLTVTDQAAQRLLSGDGFVKIIHRNNDITLQEEWYRDGTVLRNNSLVKRSASSMSMQPSTTNIPFNRSISISISNGETIRLIGYCQYDTNYYNGGTGFIAPSLTLSGTINNIVLIPVIYTATSANAGSWELIDKSITNNSGADGQITVTFSVQSTATTGKVYWDGINIDPFVTRARHYGFIFDESNPKRIVNPTFSVSEVIAAAYTGITVSWGATSNITAFSSDQTFQKLYDYTQAQACLNINSAVPITGTGLAGNPTLVASGNITITSGYKLNGTGSIRIGSYILSSELSGSIPYTYTGGTWSQLTTVPTVNGGQLNIGAAGTYTLNMGGATIYSMTPTSPSTYIMSAGTFSDIVDLRNVSAHAITVQLPVGASYTTANNIGGTITVLQAATVGVKVTALALDTSLPVVGARVYLLAAAGGPLALNTVILSGLTDASGVFQDVAFTYSSNQPVIGKVRKSTGSPLYKTAPLSGNITSSGYDATAFMIGDE